MGSRIPPTYFDVNLGGNQGTIINASQKIWNKRASGLFPFDEERVKWIMWPIELL